MKTIKTSTLSFSYLEPAKSAHKTVLFFSLSASDSLTLSPFCHPVNFLLEQGVTVLSTTLPFHEENARPYPIAKIWSENIDIISSFLDNLKTSVKELTNHFPGPFGAMGISRGAFVSYHLANSLDVVSAVCGFAPLLSLPNNESLSLILHPKNLGEKKVHFFIGHNDTAVDTKTVMSFSASLMEEKKQESKVYTTMFPSIGRHGHGTSNTVFKQGANWLKDNL